MPNVKLYTAPACVYCKMTKDFLEKNKIGYAEYNVAEDEKALDEMIKKSRQMGVPVIDIDGEIFIGFDRKGLMRALNIGQ